MQALGGYILRGRLQAAVSVSLIAVLALFIPPLFLFSGIPTGLIILRKGPVMGLQVLLLSLPAVVCFMLFSQLNPWLAFVYALVIWLPIYICCVTLRQTASHGHVVFIAGLIATAYVLFIHYLVGDVTAWWLDRINEFVAGVDANHVRDQYHQVLVKLAPMLNGIVAASIAMNLVVKSLLSRWWQSTLFNPGGFRTEFHALRLPGAVICLPLISIVLLSFGTQYWDSAKTAGSDILFIAVIVYSLQGLAAVHRTVSLRNLHHFWLISMYVFLFLEPRMLLLIAFLGIIDLWASRTKTDYHN